MFETVLETVISISGLVFYLILKGESKAFGERIFTDCFWFTLNIFLNIIFDKLTY